MKKHCLPLLIFIPSLTFAQWTTSGTNINNTNTGNVGIGTSSPETKLDVYSATNVSLKIRNESYTSGYAELKLEAKRYASPGNQAGLVANASGSALNGIPTETFGMYSTWRPMVFSVGTGDGNVYEYMRINQNGNVGIGTINPDYKLTVNGKIKCEELQVVVNVADYVFEPDYKLRTLEEVDQFIKENKHLPGVPGAAEVEEKGYKVGEMNNKLLEKIEELTLYMIQLNRENEALKAEIENIKSRINK